MGSRRTAKLRSKFIDATSRVQYLSEKDIHFLLEDMCCALLAKKPEDELGFLITMLNEWPQKLRCHSRRRGTKRRGSRYAEQSQRWRTNSPAQLARKKPSNQVQQCAPESSTIASTVGTLTILFPTVAQNSTVTSSKVPLVSPTLPVSPLDYSVSCECSWARFLMDSLCKP